MPKKELLLPLAFVALCLAFVCVCALVVISRNHPYFIKKKLRLGALLLGLSSAAACGCGPGDDIIMCYDPAPPADDMSLDLREEVHEGFDITMNLEVDTELYGVIGNCAANSYSFLLVDASGTVVQLEDIMALDGAYDDYDEDFLITIRDDLPVGDYTLSLFAMSAQEIEDIDAWRSQYFLHIGIEQGD